MEEEWDGVLITGHSLGGAIAQISAVLAHKYHRLLELKQDPPWDLTKRFFDDKKLLIDDSARRPLMQLLDSACCITFEAPMPFSPKRDGGVKQLAVLEWLDAHAINYCTATDPVPHLPRQLDSLKQAFREGWLYSVTKQIPVVGKFVDVVLNARGLAQIAEQYEPLVPTLFVGPGEPVEASGSAAGGATVELDRRFDSCLRGSNRTDAVLEGITVWHDLCMIAPYVVASLGGRLP
eukprot:3335510-Prymnesium_polylepis.2